METIKEQFKSFIDNIYVQSVEVCYKILGLHGTKSMARILSSNKGVRVSLFLNYYIP